MGTLATAAEVSRNVCRKNGHHITLFENGKFLCIQCGLTLAEIRDDNGKQAEAA